MEPEPSIGALLKAIQALSTQVGSLQDQIKSQGKQITQLTALCKETNDLVGDKDQGGAQTKPGPSTGPTTPPTHTGGEAHTPATIRPGLKAPFQPSRGTGSSVKRPKMDLPDPYKGDTRGRKATQWLDQMMLWVALHRDQFNEEEQMGKGNPPTTIQALTAKFKEAFADPDAKQAAARKIAALSQTTTTSKYVTEFCNLMAELDWNEEAYIAQFTQGLHWKVKELLSTKDREPSQKGTRQIPATVATTSTTTTQRVRLSEDPNYVTPEERDRRRASGLCVKCGQKGHGIKQCPNGWKATIKEVAKVAEEEVMHNHPTEPLKTLIDSGATSNFISPAIVEKYKIPKTLLENPRVVRMLDGTISQTGRIWHQVQLAVSANGHPHTIPFLVCPIGNTPAILGMTWLTAETPLINWQQGLVTFPEQIQIASEEEADSDPLADLPSQYHEFAKVFGEEEFKVLPPHREYDISIDLVPDAKLTPGPIYGMTDAESKALKQHIDEELATGKIRPVLHQQAPQ
ncbi:Paternally expressed 10 [Rhizoctonia solani]|uniref:Paternally expressed 10 n=1 Tax=Rhizoctonia solani TaxID=456999 RepID=A0A8H7LWD4_9AGAM|nr:Paternally expressed 10 [Rhizoctonia solani]